LYTPEAHHGKTIVIYGNEVDLANNETERIKSGNPLERKRSSTKAFD
jgi:hypothetical protein